MVPPLEHKMGCSRLDIEISRKTRKPSLKVTLTHYSAKNSTNTENTFHRYLFTVSNSAPTFIQPCIPSPQCTLLIFRPILPTFNQKRTISLCDLKRWLVTYKSDLDRIKTNNTVPNIYVKRFTRKLSSGNIDFTHTHTHNQSTATYSH